LSFAFGLLAIYLCSITVSAALRIQPADVQGGEGGRHAKLLD
jgi:hypothetical protein